MRTRTTILIALLIGITGIAGCTKSGPSASSGAASAAPVPNGGAAGAPAGPASSSGSTSPTGSQKDLLPSLGKPVVETADMTVQTSDVAAAADRATAIATRLVGSVTGDVRTGSSEDSADLTLLVPPSQLPIALDQLSRLGHEIARQTSAQDITATTADVSSRVASAQAGIARLRSLYDRAAAVSDVITIEAQLAQREADLESLQAQQRALSAQTDNATINLHLQAMSPPPAKKTHTGVLGGLASGWHSFLDVARWLVVALAILLPFLVVAILIGAAVVLIRRRRRGVASPE